MASVLNPFVWDRPLDDPAKIVGMEGFAREVALTLDCTDVGVAEDGTEC